MKLTINGKQRRLTDASTVAYLLKLVNPDDVRVAVVVNDNVIRQERRNTHILKNGDNVEIIAFAGGG